MKKQKVTITPAGNILAQLEAGGGELARCQLGADAVAAAIFGDAVIFLRGVYHQLTRAAAFNASLHAALRPGGRLVIEDFPPRRLLSLFGRAQGRARLRRRPLSGLGARTRP